MAEYEAIVAEAANDEGTLEEQLADLQAQNAALLAYLNLLMTKDSGTENTKLSKIRRYRPLEYLTLGISVCSLITGVSAVCAVVAAIAKKAKAPNDIQNERIADLERRVSQHDEIFTKDLRRFERLENGNKITQKAILSLLSHALDGNEIEGLRRSKEELQNFLIEQ